MNGVSRSTKIEVLSSTNFFSLYSSAELDLVSKYSQIISYQKGKKIFLEGEKAKALYIVIDGEISITKSKNIDEQVEIARFENGDCFGELDMLNEDKRKATALTTMKSTLLRFPSEGCSMEDLYKTNTSLGATILHKLLTDIAHRIRKSNNLVKEKSPLVDDLKKQLYVDPLSGLYNKTYFDEKVSEIIQNIREVSVVMFKPDNFKKINDNYGHETGDKALKLISAEANRLIEKECSLARYNGNEHSFLLFNGKNKNLLQIENIKKGIESLCFKKLLNGDDFSLTTSFGIIHYSGEKLSTTQILSAAHELVMAGRSSGGSVISQKEAKEVLQ